jgi:DNA polymerase-1
MKKTWLLIDSSFLCWRAYHSIPRDLAHAGVSTNVLYGFFRALKSLQSTHGTNCVAFCFDLGPYKRKELYPPYKSNVLKASVANDHMDEARSQVRRQIDLLRTDYLERVGYQNVFFQKGYEADDIIASICNNLAGDDKAIIVSADKDLYQLLSPGKVSIWNPVTNSAKQNGKTTAKSFTDNYCGLKPDQWHLVKAIAGCPGDNVPGIRGVGEVIASAYLCGRNVSSGSKANIENWIEGDQYIINKQLVKLPYPGCREFKPVEDEVDRKEWDKLMKSLGMTTLKQGDF